MTDPLRRAAAGRCSHCGRSVRETVHTRDSYRVDFFRMHTGQTEPATIVIDHDGRTQAYEKLIRVDHVVTCADCYRRPEIRSARGRWEVPHEGR